MTILQLIGLIVQTIYGEVCTIHVNTCPAGPGYIRFEDSFNPNKMPLKLIKYSVVDTQLVENFNLGDVYFS